MHQRNSGPECFILFIYWSSLGWVLVLWCLRLTRALKEIWSLFNQMFIELLLCVVSVQVVCWKYILNTKTFPSFVVPQSISGPESFIAESLLDICRFLNQYFLVLSLVLPKTISRPESFITEVAGDCDSFQMICFNVIFYGTTFAFLSTNFAHIS